MRDIKYIVIHCTASIEGKKLNSNDIDLMHKKRGWNGIGYHFVVCLDGSIENGRPIEKIGAHVKGYNKNSIGVVYVGGLDKNKKPKDTRNKKQKESLRCLINDLKEKFPKSIVLGHRDLSKDLNGNGVIESFEYIKLCPCFNAKEEYK